MSKPSHVNLSKCIRPNFMILLNTEQPSIGLNHNTTVNYIHCHNADLREANIIIHNTRSRNTFIVRYSQTNLKAMYMFGA